MRLVGFEPNVIDNAELWSLVRKRSTLSKDPNKIVVLGTSRALLGIVPQVLENQTNGTDVFHLPINGSWPYAPLRDIASEGFAGTVIVECMVPFATTEKARESQLNFVEFYQRNYRHLGFLQSYFNRQTATFLQSKLVIWSTFSNPYALLRKSLPKPSYMRTFPSRWRAAHYDLRPPKVQAASKKRRLSQAESFDFSKKWQQEELENWHYQLELLAQYVARIKQSGGSVVFVRMPTAPEIWVIDERNYPRSEFWDLLDLKTEATTFHYQDYESTRNLRCPDFSHLDPEGAEAFTKALAQFILDQRTK